MKTAKPLVLAALTGITLSACTAGVDTTVDVTDPEEAAVTVAATFTGEAADALIEDAKSLADLEETVKAKTGASPDVDVDEKGHKVTVSTPLTYTKLEELRDITGIKSISLAPDGESTTTTIKLTAAPKLKTAISDAVKNQPDAAILAETMADTTTVTTHVTYGGSIDTLDTQGLADDEADLDGDTVTITRAVADADTATVTITGDPTTPWYQMPITLIGGGLAALAAGYVTIRRRGQRSGQHMSPVRAGLPQ